MPDRFALCCHRNQLSERGADQINGWSTQGVALTRRMMWSGLETASLDAAIELESHTPLYLRLTTKNFEEATLARKEGREPEFLD